MKIFFFPEYSGNVYIQSGGKNVMMDSVVVIIVTGVLGNIFAEKFLGLLSIKEPIAKGIAIGCSAHALGTAKAMEMGTIEGAMSSLSIVVCGVMTVVGASIFALFM